MDKTLEKEESFSQFHQIQVFQCSSRDLEGLIRDEQSPILSCDNKWDHVTYTSGSHDIHVTLYIRQHATFLPHVGLVEDMLCLKTREKPLKEF